MTYSRLSLRHGQSRFVCRRKIELPTFFGFGGGVELPPSTLSLVSAPDRLILKTNTHQVLDQKYLGTKSLCLSTQKVLFV